MKRARPRRWTRRRCRVLAIAMYGVLGCAPGVEQSTVPRSPEQPSGLWTLRSGEELYREKQYARAAWIFQRLAQDPLSVDYRRAEFCLGKSYFHLDDFDRAAAIMVKIAGDPDDPFPAQAVPWLLSIRRKRPDDREVVEALARIGPEVIDKEFLIEYRSDLQTAIAEHMVRTHQPEDALAMLAVLSPEKSDWGDVNLWMGRAALELRRTRMAAECFRVAATWGLPTRKDLRLDRRRRRRGFGPRPRFVPSPFRDHVVSEATAELERLGES